MFRIIKPEIPVCFEYAPLVREIDTGFKVPIRSAMRNNPFIFLLEVTFALACCIRFQLTSLKSGKSFYDDQSAGWVGLVELGMRVCQPELTQAA
jgi:hypothetical protein